MKTESVVEMMRTIQIKQARKFFETFGRIDKVFVNGGEVKPWHIDSVLVGTVRDWEKLKGFSIHKINGVCTLQISMQSAVPKRRKV